MISDVDAPTFSERVGTAGKAILKAMLDHPGVTAIVFFVGLALMGVPILLMALVFLAGWFGYSAGRRKKDDGHG